MELNDLQIAEKIKNKNIKAYEYVVDKYTKQIYYLAYNILNLTLANEDIEECVSDVFFYMWQNIDKFDSDRGSLKTWLFTITKYKALDLKRKYKNKSIINIDDLVIEDKEDIEKKVIDREIQQKVIDIICMTFNNIDREIFIRRFFYNEKISTLERDYNLSRAAIDNRLLRGRKKIKEALSDV